MNIVRAVAIVCVLLAALFTGNAQNSNNCSSNCICRPGVSLTAPAAGLQCTGNGPGGKCVKCCDTFHEKLILSDADGDCTTIRGYAYTPDSRQFDTDNGTKFLVGYCYFCAILDLETALTGSYVALNDNGTSTCQDHSHGLLCGYCDDGYSRNLGGKCVVCDNSKLTLGWFVYIISQFVPITIWFFILLFTGRTVRLVGGALNSAIFFAQMVTTTMDLDGDGFIPISNLTMDNSKIAYGVKSVYHFVYQAFNLNFFYPFVEMLCLLKTPTYLPYVAVQYSVAFYPLVLIGIVQFFMWLDTKTERCHGRLRKKTPAEAANNMFASFIILSHQKFILISAMLLRPNKLIERSGETNRHVLFYDPSVGYSKGYITFAVIFYLLAFVLPFLLMIHYECKWINSLVEPFQRPYHKRHIKVNISQHQYRLPLDERRFPWVAGLYFHLRLFFITIFVLAPLSYQFILKILLCLIAAVFFFIYQPYIKQWHNKLDAFFFILLAFINTLSLYQYFLTTNGKSLSLTVFIVQYILIFVPLLWMAGLIFHCLYQRCRRCHGICVIEVHEDEFDDAHSTYLDLEGSNNLAVASIQGQLNTRYRLTKNL